MLKKSLICHPDTPCPSAHVLQVEIESNTENAIQLSYRLTGDIAKILIPEPMPANATDGLWQHTCFELFLAQTDTPAYHEFNFSPSGEWAAYAFQDYRKRMPWTIGQPPVVTSKKTRSELILTSRIDAAELLSDGNAHSLQLGVSAVVESLTGELSYWALHHPGERPDFHDRRSFVCPLITC